MNWRTRMTWILALSVGVLLMVGAVTLYSCTTHHQSLQRLYLHLGWMGAGILCATLAAACDYSWLRRGHAPKWLLGLAVVLLAAVLVPGIGVTKNGAARWLPLGQPSEFAKLALIIFLADYSASHARQMKERERGFLIPGSVVGLVVLLIFVEPDWGTATLTAAAALLLLTLAGTHRAYLLSATIIGAELLVLLLLRNPLRLERIMVFLNPQRYKDGVGWQTWQAQLSLGSGGWVGTSFGEGSHKNGFVPELQTDFILSVMGEELGFVGLTLVLLLYAIILLCGARISWRARNPFGQLLASGIAWLIGLQAFINVGVVTSSLPNKGLALPFVSYGGSNLICMLTAIGLLISVVRHAPAQSNRLGGNKVGRSRTPQVGGPIGSLLYPAAVPEPKGWRGFLTRWQRARRGARFPKLPVHSYQRRPESRNTASGVLPNLKVLQVRVCDHPPPRASGQSELTKE